MAKRRGGRAPRKRPEPARSGGVLGKLLKRVFVGVVTLTLICALALGTAVFFAARNIPGYWELKSRQNAQTIVVRARDGREIVTLGPSYGEWLSSDEIPQIMKDAMVAVEDRRFYSHFGIDVLGLLRAVFVSIRDDERASATSTITQQLARNLFLNSNRTIDRKVREAVLAMALEARFSKEQILELYLNKVYFGGGAYGVDSASREFFSHSARDLSTAEAAIIAGMVKAPSRYSPTADVDAAIGRANVVLETMRRYGAIGADQAAQVDVSTVNLKREAGQNSVRYFSDWVLPQLDLLLDSSRNFEPIEVWTTLDIELQRAATNAVTSHVPKGVQGALVSLDRDGAILAMVGGTDYVSTNYNRATSAVRQPGSAWKLFVYLTALEAGYTPEDRVVDAPVTIDGWRPQNSGQSYAGPIDVRTAFAYSKNTVAAQLGDEVGFHNVAAMARRFGITTPISTYPSMVLGTSEVRVIDLTRAFASIAARGRSVEPYGILKVTTADGRLLYRRENYASAQLVPEYVAAEMTDLLQTAVSTGTGKAAQIGRPVAGKTGTTSSNKDGWFVGFSSGITTGVWVGRDDATPVAGLQGGSMPARIFASYMRRAVASRPVERFDTDLRLPQWQLEPDDEFFFGDPDDYYFLDEYGNLVDPREFGEPAWPGQSEPYDRGGSDRGGQPFPPPPAVQVPMPGPPAASEEFLEQATGGEFAAGWER